jgi:adenylate cyclase
MAADQRDTVTESRFLALCGAIPRRKPGREHRDEGRTMAEAVLRRRIANRVAESFTREAQSGARHNMYARTVALSLIALWLSSQIPFPGAFFYIGLLAVFIAIGFAQNIIAARFPALTWPPFALIFVDAALLAYTLIAPNPLISDGWPRQVPIQNGSFMFFFVMLVGTLLSYDPRRVLWAGFCMAACYGAGVVWVLHQPDTITPANFSDWDSLTMREQVDIASHPNFVLPRQPMRDIVLLTIVTGILASVVWRVRGLVLRQSETERQRANLVRYFSPEIATELAQSDQPLGEYRRQSTAVLFVDIVGFTGLAERMGPEDTMTLLREFHGRMAAQVFAHRGTLDKYIGDAVMATFGSLHKGDADAADALRCVRAMIDDVAEWNAIHDRSGQLPIGIGIGAHFDPVVVGDIGDERRLEFAVIGDAVNVASRMERMTRELHARAVLSDDLVLAAREEAKQEAPLLSGLDAAGTVAIRGREAPMAIWTIT